jgi:tetratricopeptide (TPR) repeat protein
MMPETTLEFLPTPAAAAEDDKLKSLIDRLNAQRAARQALMLRKYAAECYPITPDQLHVAPGGPVAAGERDRPTLPADRFEGLSAEDVFVLACHYRGQGDLRDAIEAYACLVARQRLLERVIPQLEEIVARSPRKLKLLQLLGDAYLRSGRAQLALEVYRRALGRISAVRTTRQIALQWLGS